MTATLVTIEGDIRDYAWGTPGGISRVLGRPAPDAPEAELWLGAHPSAPSRAVTGAAGWTDLAEWERSGAGRVPYLLKVLSAVSPLSLQAHPTPEQALEGFARENAEGIPIDARERNYKDPYSKPELIVALEDGFEALCGFRPVDETIAEVDALSAAATDAGLDEAPFARWRALLAGDDGIRAAFVWLLDGGADVEALIASVTQIAAQHPDRFELPGRLAAGYPGDPGVAAALMLNHVTLAAGESLWLPAGNVHAYLRGTGMELMGPSDNVLRGGLTPKHVDTGELGRVLDFTGGEPPHLAPVPVADSVVSYRPRSLASGADVAFELLDVSADARIETGSPAIGIVVEGEFRITGPEGTRSLERGESVFVTDAATLEVRGAGRLFIATA
ncbi:mannose-6-phosphate isomerase [Microbacterium terrae]|uniref:mannose-6-phosphate isomerase n=1 Tax=Microbacterium terrae TaxID=69369 RepID=A0A0M2HM49_9MICO|nr:mannose-6-phosphate isomerase, class I [Microbacterium terrae]KJL45500.1 Mannose-6-phosphate isomerase [Microbacterium terrae]MBP1078447.1 mannose-6-phosphate isomerase [Microbacterium terrae]GLJ99347.1 putative mannose-6-phosphate isomerase ManA [Microbacterium terrae]